MATITDIASNVLCGKRINIWTGVVAGSTRLDRKEVTLSKPMENDPFFNWTHVVAEIESVELINHNYGFFQLNLSGNIKLTITARTQLTFVQ